MAVQTEVWEQDIQEVLFSGQNEFLRASVSHDAFVDESKVHVPQAGSLPGAEKNRVTIPATITKRDDTTLDYELNEYTTDPVVIRDIDEVEVSFDKRQSVMRQHNNVLMDRVAKEGIFDWASDTLANQVRTTGTLVDDNLSPLATGDRRRLTVVDIKNLAKAMDEQNVPDNDRWLLLPAAMYYEIFTINDLIKADIAGALTLPSGVANKVLGFNVVKRSSTVIYDNAGTPQRRAVGAAGAATDNFGGIAWHKDFVANALGAIKVFEDEDNPVMYGTVLSALVRNKTTKLRTDEAGIATLIQAAS